MRFSSSGFAVSMMMGIKVVRTFSRSFWHTVKPSTSGIITSNRIRSGCTSSTGGSEDLRGQRQLLQALAQDNLDGGIVVHYQDLHLLGGLGGTGRNESGFRCLPRRSGCLRGASRCLSPVRCDLGRGGGRCGRRVILTSRHGRARCVRQGRHPPPGRRF